MKKKYYIFFTLVLLFFFRVNTTFAVTYATWDSGNKGSNLTLSNGNLTGQSIAEWNSVRSTIGKGSGKWYWEITVDSVVFSGEETGVGQSTISNFDTFFGDSNAGYAYRKDGQYENASNQFSFGSAFVNGDVIGVGLDMDNGIVSIYLNGVSQGNLATGLAGTQYAFLGLNTATMTANFGQTAFSFSVPSGFCEGLSDTCVGGGGGGGGPTGTTTMATSSPMTYEESLLIYCVIIFCVSFLAWGVLFSPTKA